ncbi:MAG: hypothetical protein PHQ52_05905 [Candidatus Omnitrophica bacterium]|nr:hypothetical protein [Candidatus Omnitrophota bacterium]
MKKYPKPIIAFVKLDAEQAILQICKSGGGFFSTTHSPVPVCQRTNVTGHLCYVGQRGVQNKIDESGSTPENIGS